MAAVRVLYALPRDTKCKMQNAKCRILHVPDLASIPARTDRFVFLVHLQSRTPFSDRPLFYRFSSSIPARTDRLEFSVHLQSRSPFSDRPLFYRFSSSYCGNMLYASPIMNPCA